MKQLAILNLSLITLRQAHAIEVTKISTPKNGYSFTNESYSYLKRPSPPSIVEGTSNWEKLQSTGPSMFSPRHSHATCVFKCPNNEKKKCIWLTGGRTELYRTWDLRMEDRRSDIWWSEDGSAWNKVTEIYGDFLQGVGDHDAKVGGEAAPWYSRYGHSLDVIDTDGDGEDDIMVLMGGNNPLPSNDIWISPNGTTWFFERYAVWSERAYHATAVFKKRLWVMGGTPLNNEVWSGFVVKDSSQRSGFRIWWTLKLDSNKAPWAPRCAMCVVKQTRQAKYYSLKPNGNVTLVEDPEPKEVLYLIGGFAGWPRDDTRWNGERTRNDVWVSEDGIEWNLVLPSNGRSTMPFTGRGWHACTTWHNEADKQMSVKTLSRDEGIVDDRGPKIFISGGGYMGTKGNNEVRTLEGYLDMWWSYDGSHWVRVNYEEGSDQSLYSTNEWTSVLIKKEYVYRGKWGHSLLSFPALQDINLDGVISNTTLHLEFCSGTTVNIGQCKHYSVNEEKVPSLFIIGGDTTDGGPIVNDVFRSRPGVMCERGGIPCSNRGSCGPATIGCVCDNEKISGEYCERVDENISVSSAVYNSNYQEIVIFSIFIFSLHWII